MHSSRRTQAEAVRKEAATFAAHRPHPWHVNNKEEYEYRDCTPGSGADQTPTCPATHIANFTKGLPHDTDTGLLLNPVDYKLFINGIQTGDPVDFEKTPLGPALPPKVPGAPSRERITVDTDDRSKIWESNFARGVNPSSTEKGARVRAWESAGAGNVFDLEGPDAQAVTMPPAPRFDSEELLAEIAEIYAMALVRDVPFAEYSLPKPGAPSTNKQFLAAKNFLQQFRWFNGSDKLKLSAQEASRRRTLRDDGSNLFRGITPGEEEGPYLSQFLLLGNDSIEKRGTANANKARTPELGYIQYGAIGIEQKVRVAEPNKDYMTAWEPFIDVQNGADLRGQETYVPKGTGDHRFIATPRDLATYVHYDALYEAYLNACIFLLASGAPFDRGIPFLEADVFDKQQGFAHFGGPHILTLVTEVATRALKAVRYQKFNNHRRLRPEAMGGLFDRWMNKPKLNPGPLAPFKPIAKELKSTDLKWGGKPFVEFLAERNQENNDNHFAGEASAKKKSYLLPMAFPEGSPMHPAYGAGHATVAGACITVLKAYFDHGWTPPAFFDTDGKPIAYVPADDGSKLNAVELDKPLTVEGELNKLAANIAIGRNWAGVHYFTDYIESFRMGEQVAIGLLEEQKLLYPENFTMTVPLFDGGAVRI